MLFCHIKLTIYQMISVGMHLGHTLSSSIFLSYWMYGGTRNHIFIIDLVKTKMLIRFVIERVCYSLGALRPFWFVNTVPGLNYHVYKYALLCGESYCIYKWIYGSITNILNLSRWNWILLNLLKTGKYKLRHKDKKQILNFTGFLLNRWRRPGIGFISRPFESASAINEFYSAQINYIIIVDSNFNSDGHLLPIAGNDDSIACINFYCYFFAFFILNFKIAHLLKWQRLSDEVAKQEAEEGNSLVHSKNSLLHLYLFKRKFAKWHNNIEFNNSLIKSSFLFFNDNFNDIKWVSWKTSLFNAHVKYAYFAMFNLDNINENYSSIIRPIYIPQEFYGKNVFNPYVVY